MNRSQLVSYLLDFPEASEDYPFGPDAQVFKVREKMFALLGSFEWHGVSCLRLNLKCDPQQALMLRDVFTAVVPGYHMNKKHWNSVILDGSIPDHELLRMMNHSYALIVKSLKKAERHALELRWGAHAIYR